MEDHQSHKTEKILNLALEIIYLLTGEIFPPLKDKDQLTFTVPPPRSLMIKINNGKKILEVTKKMMELLTGEVPIRCQDVSVYFSMEEWEYLEGHRDLYKDVVMRDQQILSCVKKKIHLNEKIHKLSLEIIYLLIGEVRRILGGSGHIILLCFNFGHSQQRCPPVKSGDQVTIAVPPPCCLTLERKNKQKILEVTKKIIELLSGEVPIRCQDVSVYFSMEEWEYLGGDRDLYKDIRMDGHNVWRTSKEHLMTSPEDDTIGFRIIQWSPEVKHDARNTHHRLSYGGRSGDPSNPEEPSHNLHIDTPNIDPGDHSVDGSADSSNPEEHSNKFPAIIPNILPRIPIADNTSDPPDPEESSHGYSDASIHNDEAIFPQSTDDRCLTSTASLAANQKTNAEEQPSSCSECGKSFKTKSNLLRHSKVHSGVWRYPCPECGESFLDRCDLIKHLNCHMGEGYVCKECGKCFKDKPQLTRHLIVHTGKKPFSCSECGKCFPRKDTLIMHQRTHRGKKTFSCPECGKLFFTKSDFVTHMKSHPGKKPFTCSECSKRFSKKGNLDVHIKIHTGEKTLSRLECGKSLVQKGSRHTHQRTHKGQNPFSCVQCGKRFTSTGNLINHKRLHALSPGNVSIICDHLTHQRTHV